MGKPVKKVVVFVANRGYALTSSRSNIIQRFLSSGWDVVIATADDCESEKLCAMGTYFEPVAFNRGGVSLLGDVMAYNRLSKIYRKWEPLLIHHFHAKPVILGSLAAHHALGGKTIIINTITGLGHAFIVGGVVARLAGFGYKRALPLSAATIFQNRDDLSLFSRNGWIEKEKAKLITGSGVDLGKFRYIKREGRGDRSLTVVMLGRLLRQKGVLDFIRVAKYVKQQHPGVRFVWAGEEDTVHPDAVKVSWINTQKAIEYIGRIDDVPSLLSKSDVLFFSSYYREGVPRVILEAAAMGLPTVGLDVPGVREAVQHEKTGYLIAQDDTKGVEEKIVKLLESETLRLSMGRAARKFMEKKFDKRDIEEQYMTIYKNLGMDVK